MVWWEFVLIVLFVILCGIFNGNNIGIMAYDVGYLEMLSKVLTKRRKTSN